MHCPPAIISNIPDGAMLHFTLIPDPADPGQFRSFADFQSQPVAGGAPSIERWPHDEIVSPRVKRRLLTSDCHYALDPIRVAFMSSDQLTVEVLLSITHGDQTLFE